MKKKISKIRNKAASLHQPASMQHNTMIIFRIWLQNKYNHMNETNSDHLHCGLKREEWFVNYNKTGI